MDLRRLFPLTLITIGLVVALVALGLVRAHLPARALPPAGTDNVSVNADVSVRSRIGSETIHFAGTATIVRQNSHLESGAEVVDDSITALDLAGQSIAGSVTASQSMTTNSTGQIRSVNPSPSEYPATSFFDVFVNVHAPQSCLGCPPSITLHNDVAIHLVAMPNVNSWPPYGVTYAMEPNAGPTPTPSPTPTASPPPGTPPCGSGVLLLPKLPNEVCVSAVTLTLSAPPTPTPSPTPTSTATPCVPACTPTPTMTPGTPTPIGVSGNDNFANAWQIGELPFSKTENTVDFGTEQGEPLTTSGLDHCITTPPNYMGATAWFRFSPSVSGTVNVDTNNSNYDTVLAVYTGSALNSLALVTCDDDTPSGLQAAVSFPAEAGTTYYIQAGGFEVAAGQLVLEVQELPLTGTPTPTATPTATPTRTATPTPAELIGDANEDGMVDAIDAALVLQYSAGLLSSINPNADANGDGQINAIDATLILQFAAGLINRLPP